MDESAIKGLELRDLNGSDADIRKSSSSIRRIYVEGYDTSLRTFDVALSLREHFASCGEILHIDIHPDLGSGLLNRFGFIYVNGEGAVEKVLGLGGSEMGEPNVVTKAYPFRETHYDLDLAPIKAPESRRGDIIRRICVEGYDTSLPAVDVKRILISHFATCGELVHVYIPTDVGSGRLNRFGFVYVRGEGAEKRMLRLSGSVMGEEWSVDAMSYPFRETDLSIALAPTEVNSSSSIRRIYVEGYDTSLSAYHVHLALREHFASCGEVVHVYTPTEVGSPSRLVKTLNRYGFIYVRGEGAEEKALELSGSDMGGRIVVTKAYPFHETYLDLELAPMIAAETERQHVMRVTGYDTSLSDDYVRSMLIEHFSSCSYAGNVFVFQDQGVSQALLRMEVGDAIDKALQLSGREVRGLNIVVTSVSLPASPEESKSFGTF